MSGRSASLGPNSMPRLTARDFKNTRRQRRLALERWREFGAGLGVGLVLAAAAFVSGQRSVERAAADQAPARPEPRPPATAPAAEATEAEGSARQYDFYEMLPQFEVIVPERERDVERLPAARIERPGVYVLQAGSYRNVADADRVRKQLALQGIDAIVQRVAVDADVWHRVRIGPVSDLREVNRLRSRLHAAEIDALVIRVGE